MTIIIWFLQLIVLVLLIGFFLYKEAVKQCFLIENPSVTPKGLVYPQGDKETSYEVMNNGES